MEEEFVDEMLVTTLRFWIKKIKRGDCTREQQKAFLDAIDSVGDVQGTIDEIAEFYGKSKDAVNSVIKRNYIGKPKRNVAMYSFSKFRKVAPKSWYKNGQETICKPKG